MTGGLFFALGGLAGMLQATLLRRSAVRGVHPVSAFLRLAAVAAALVLAALHGHLVAGAAGWAVAFALGTALFAWRWS